jgi:hypothetical protein
MMAALTVSKISVSPPRREAQDDPSPDLQLVVAGAVIVEGESCPMRFPSVVLDCDLDVRVSEVESDGPAADSDAVLLDRFWQARPNQQLGDVDLPVAPTWSHDVDAISKHGSHDRAAPAAPVLEGLKDTVKLTQRHDASALGIVHQTLDAPRPHDSGEVAQCASHGGDGNAVAARRMDWTPDVRLMHDDVGGSRVLPPRHRDLEYVGVESR